MSEEHDNNDDGFALPTQKPDRSQAEIDAAEKQIVAQIKDVRYIVREYPVEVVVQKYLSGRKAETNEIYVPIIKGT